MNKPLFSDLCNRKSGNALFNEVADVASINRANAKPEAWMYTYFDGPRQAEFMIFTPSAVTKLLEAFSFEGMLEEWKPQRGASWEWQATGYR